jgi:hypothetical protein
MGKKGKFKVIKPAQTPPDDGEYRSPSTLDNPPREEKEPPAEVMRAGFDENGQAEIPGAESPKAPERQSRRVKFKLQLKADDYVLPVAGGECPADMIEESLGKGLNSDRFRSVLREVVGQPLNTRLCDQQLATEREQSLATAVRNYASGLDSLGYMLPDNPEKQDHEYVCRKIRDARARLKELQETAEKQLQTSDDEDLCAPRLAQDATGGASPGAGAGIDERF